MQYEPHVASTQWPHAPRKADSTRPRSKIAVEIDHIRLARLLILIGLVGFWIMVFMAIF